MERPQERASLPLATRLCHLNEMVRCRKNRRCSRASHPRFRTFERPTWLGFLGRKCKVCGAKGRHCYPGCGSCIDPCYGRAPICRVRTASALFAWSSRPPSNQARPHPCYWLDARASDALSERRRQIALIDADRNKRAVKWLTMQTSGPSIPALSVIVPTYQESANIPILFERIKVVLNGLPWEMIVVDDDSPDGTSSVAFALAAKDHRVRCLTRVNRSGLAGAVIEGWMSSSADFVAVIDGDLQHDESILRVMYQALADGAGNLAVGTRLRKANGGSLSPARQRLSDLGAWCFRRIGGATVTDPMSGFFMIRREIISRLAPRLSADGFNILFTVTLSAGGSLRIVEVPYGFRKRNTGESKLTPLVAIDFLGLVVHHATSGIVPMRFALFAMVGAIGLVVHRSEEHTSELQSRRHL